MTLKTKANWLSNVAISCSEQPLTGRAPMIVPRLRRATHFPGDFLAGAIFVPLSGDVNRNLEASADDFAGVTPDVNAAAILIAGVQTKSERRSEVGFAAALDDEDEDEDDDYDDDDLDEEDDEDLDDEDEDDAEFDDEDDLDDEDDVDDLDDDEDDLDDEE